MTVDLSDAGALLQRAKRHYAEFNAAVHKREGRWLWHIQSRFDERSESWIYALDIDRPRLNFAKPILADAATNAISALDNIAGAIARSEGHDRLRSLYFPGGRTDAEYERALERAARYIGPEMAAVITATRAKHSECIHAEAAKEISNSGKHWELLPSFGDARAIAINIPGEQRQQIFQIPEGAFNTSDEYVFHRGSRLPDAPVSIVVSLEVAGLPEGLPKWPDTILECTFRYVQAMIEAVAEADRS